MANGIRAIRTILTALLLAGLFAACANQSRSDSNPYFVRAPDDHPVQRESLDEMLEHEDFDLARALLLFSNEYYPEFEPTSDPVNVEERMATWTKYADELRASLSRLYTPRSRLRRLVEFVHIKLGLRFDRVDRAGHKPENLFLDKVLERRYGYCVTLSLAYLVFGQMAGVDVQGIRIPGHFAVLYRDMDDHDVPFERVIETTNQGQVRDDISYFVQYRFSSASVRNGVFLTALNDRQIFGTLFNNLAGLTHLRGNDELAVERYSRALELAPRNIEAMYNRGLILHRLGQDRDAMRDFNAAIRLAPNFALGYVARAGLLWEAGEKDAALEDVQTALRKRPDIPETHIMNGQLLAAQGQFKEARDAFLRALEIDPASVAAQNAMERLAEKWKESDE